LPDERVVGLTAEAAALEAGDVCEVPGADPTRVRLGRQRLLPDDSYARLAETFRVLADSSRAKIVHSLLGQELCTCDLAAIAGLSEPAVSQHLRLLRTLRLVKTRREGKKVFYSLADAHVRVLLTVSLRHLMDDGP
jgi:DNA-binding transcriptional ArsR family regulator